MVFSSDDVGELLDTIAQDFTWAELRDEADLRSDNALHDVFERLLANSELQWIDPEARGRLREDDVVADLMGLADDFVRRSA